MNTLSLFLTHTALGGIGGAIFGVIFGVCASIFHNGPATLTAIEQSWWWFATAGLCMGSAWALGKIMDAKKRV
jgi:hypothetical protein